MNAPQTRCVLALGAVLASSCGGGTALEGSATEVIDLSYDSCVAERNQVGLGLSFRKVRGKGEDVVFELGLALKPELPNGFSKIDLSEHFAGGGVRATARRNVFQDTLNTLPPILKGELSFKQDPTKSTTASGNLSVTFESGTQPINGRTVYGSFNCKSTASE